MGDFGSLGDLYSVGDSGQTVTNRVRSGYKAGAEIGKYQEELAFKREMRDLSAKEDMSADDIADVMLRYPQYADSLRSSYDREEKEDQKRGVKQMGMVYGAIRSGKPELAKNMLESYSSAYREAGNEGAADELEDLGKIVAEEPENAGVLAGLFLASTLGPKKFVESYSALEAEHRRKKLFPLLAMKERAQAEQALTASERNRAQAANARTEAKLKIKRFLRDSQMVTGTSPPEIKHQKVYGNGAIQLLFKDGTTSVLDPTGKRVEGREAEDALRKAVIAGIDERVREAGEVESAKKAKDMARDFIDRAASLSSSVSALEKAKDAVESGGYTGSFAKKFIGYFDKDSAFLENALTDLTFQDLGNYALGAISEGELEALRTKQMPATRDREALSEFFRKRISATEKLSLSFKEMARELSKPGATMESLYRLGKELDRDEERSAPVVAASGSELEQQGLSQFSGRQAEEPASWDGPPQFPGGQAGGPRPVKLPDGRLEVDIHGKKWAFSPEQYREFRSKLESRYED